MNFSSDNLPYGWRLQVFKENHGPQDSTQRRQASGGRAEGAAFPGSLFPPELRVLTQGAASDRAALGTSPGQGLGARLTPPTETTRGLDSPVSRHSDPRPPHRERMQVRARTYSWSTWGQSSPENTHTRTPGRSPCSCLCCGRDQRGRRAPLWTPEGRQHGTPTKRLPDASPPTDPTPSPPWATSSSLFEK